MAITVGVAGITGRFARLIVHYLLDNTDVLIRGYCRDATKLSPTLRPSFRVHIITGQAHDATSLSVFARGCSVVVCAYSGSSKLMIDGQKALIDACETEGVARYIASDYTLDYRKLDFGEIPMKDAEKTIANYIINKKISGVHVQIGILMEVLWSPFFGTWGGENMTLSFWGTGDEKWESTTYENAAHFVAELTLDTSAVGVYQFLGDRKSIFEIAGLFKSVYGTEIKLQCEGSLEDLRDLLQQKRRESPLDVSGYIPLFYKYYCTNGQCYLADGLVNEKFPQIKPTTFGDFMRLHTFKNLSKAISLVGPNY